MLNDISIKELYPLALAEGEGVGTAYEYYAKRLLLSPWLANQEKPRRILIAGLPEKYGASMDFVLLASELDADLTIVDDRSEAIERCKSAISILKKDGRIVNIKTNLIQTQNLAALPELNDSFDLTLSSEILQRLSTADQLQYMLLLLKLAGRFALFTPNGDNPAHTNHSGLSGLQLGELDTLIGKTLESASSLEPQKSPATGYIDMPPFPPGITRTEDQREQASTGTAEAIAMWGLAYYAHIERWLPNSWRRNNSHIVYAFL